MSTTYTSCPVVKRGDETFVQWVDVGGERRRMEFTKDIVWVQESESQLMYLHGGKVLMEGSTFTDYHGYLTSCGDEATTPLEAATEYDITAESSLELVVQTTVFMQPLTETAETIEHNRTKPESRKPQYAYIQDVCRQEVIEEWGTCYPCIGRKILGTGVVWTSKNSPQQNAALLEKFRRQWQVRSIDGVAS